MNNQSIKKTATCKNGEYGYKFKYIKDTKNEYRIFRCCCKKKDMIFMRGSREAIKRNTYWFNKQKRQAENFHRKTYLFNKQKHPTEQAQRPSYPLPVKKYERFIRFVLKKVIDKRHNIIFNCNLNIPDIYGYDTSLVRTLTTIVNYKNNVHSSPSSETYNAISKIASEYSLNVHYDFFTESDVLGLGELIYIDGCFLFTREHDKVVAIKALKNLIVNKRPYSPYELFPPDYCFDYFN